MNDTSTVHYGTLLNIHTVPPTLSLPEGHFAAFRDGELVLAGPWPPLEFLPRDITDLWVPPDVMRKIKATIPGKATDA